MFFNSSRANYSVPAIIMLLVSVALIFGAGCRRTPPEITFQNGDNTSAKEQDRQKEQQEATVDIEKTEPQTLAILLLTPNSQATITRGDEQTQAIHQMELYAGDEVRVVQGEVQLLYPEVGVSILPQGTKLTIIPGTEDVDGGFSSQILLEAGKIWTRLEHVFGSDDSFSVEASDVVATVRGTAFGVSVENGEIDITVADSQVTVTSREAMKRLKKTVQKSVIVAAGNALTINPQLLQAGENPRNVLLKRLRKVSEAEKENIFFRFGKRPLDIGAIQKPEQTFRWSAPIGINDKIKTRLTPEQIERLKAVQVNQIKIRPKLLEDEARMKELIQKSVRFQVPLEEVILKDNTTDTTPSATGPTN